MGLSVCDSCSTDCQVSIKLRTEVCGTDVLVVVYFGRTADLSRTMQGLIWPSSHHQCILTAGMRMLHLLCFLFWCVVH